MLFSGRKYIAALVLIKASEWVIYNLLWRKNSGDKVKRILSVRLSLINNNEIASNLILLSTRQTIHQSFFFSYSRRYITVRRRQRRSVGDNVGRTEPAVRIHRRQTHVHKSVRFGGTDCGGASVHKADQRSFRVSVSPYTVLPGAAPEPLFGGGGLGPSYSLTKSYNKKKKTI
jgi:hypothetical protein